MKDCAPNGTAPERRERLDPAETQTLDNGKDPDGLRMTFELPRKPFPRWIRLKTAAPAAVLITR
ncbi:protein of unknown function [Pararobbsia alpina]